MSLQDCFRSFCGPGASRLLDFQGHLNPCCLLESHWICDATLRWQLVRVGVGQFEPCKQTVLKSDSARVTLVDIHDSCQPLIARCKCFITHKLGWALNITSKK